MSGCLWMCAGHRTEGCAKSGREGAQEGCCGGLGHCQSSAPPVLPHPSVLLCPKPSLVWSAATSQPSVQRNFPSTLWRGCQAWFKKEPHVCTQIGTCQSLGCRRCSVAELGFHVGEHSALVLLIVATAPGLLYPSLSAVQARRRAPPTLTLTPRVVQWNAGVCGDFTGIGIWMVSVSWHFLARLESCPL